MKKNNFKVTVYILILTLLSSCNNKSQPDAYGNFTDDATTVSAESAGKLIKYNIIEGKEYKKGDTIAIIDTMQLYLKKKVLLAGIKTIYAKVENVNSQISILKEQLNSLLVNQKRIKKMLNDSAATQKQFDDINSQIKITKQKINNIKIQSNSVLNEKNSAEAQIKQIDNLISKNIIVNPVRGTVLNNFVKQSEFVAPGKPLYNIQDINTLTLKAYVSETQLSNIKLNKKVKIEVDVLKGTQTLSGTIYWINDKAEFTPKQIQTKDERQNLVYAVKIKVPNKNGMLKIGMPANIMF